MGDQPTQPPDDRQLSGSLDGPSRTIIVEPVQKPTPASPPQVEPKPAPQPSRQPAR